MAEFRKYSSIENSYQEKELARCREFVAPEAEWVALEKVHGANFSIYISRSKEGKLEIKFAKRSGFVDTDEERAEFFDFRCIEDELIESAKKVGPIVPPEMQIIIFGELIGNNSHPNLDQPWVEIRGRIQKDIPYTNKMAFIIFDVYSMSGFLRHDLVAKFERYGFLVAPVIYRGTFDDCLAVDPETLKSAVPQLLGHDEHIVDAEGIVIKPVVPHYSPNKKRIIIKQKRKVFTDVGMPCIPKMKTEDYQLSDEFLDIMEALSCYANKTRLDSVISKEGPNLPDPKLYGLAVADVYETYAREHPDCPKLKVMQKNPKAKKYINRILTNILKNV